MNKETTVKEQLLELIENMTENQIIYSYTFLSRILSIEVPKKENR